MLVAWPWDFCIVGRGVIQRMIMGGGFESCTPSVEFGNDTKRRVTGTRGCMQNIYAAAVVHHNTVYLVSGPFLCRRK